MSVDLETRLRDSLHRHVDLPVPPVEVADLVARGRRARRTKRVVRTSGLAVVVAASVGVGLLLPSHDTPADRTHEGLAPAVTGKARGPAAQPGPRSVFVTKAATYLFGERLSVELPWDTGAHIGRLGVAYPKPGSDRPMLLTLGGVAVPLAPAQPKLAGASYDGWVAADGNGPLVAWAEHTQEAADIVAFDTRSMTEVARLALPCRSFQGQPVCPRPYVVSDGRVFVNRSGRALLWDPMTGDKASIKGIPAQAHDHVYTNFEAGLPSLDLPSPWLEATIPEGMEPILSYDGAWLLDDGGGPTLVNWRHPGETITYRPPGSVVAATFDTDGSILVVTHDDHAYVGWRCDLSGPCKAVIPPQPEEIRLVASDL